MSSPDSAGAAWMAQLDADDLRALLDDLAQRVPEVGEMLEIQRASMSGDPADLLVIVNQTLTPHRRFYDYYQANAYAAQGEDTVRLLAQRAEAATPALLPVLERAITLTTRAILKSDDSSGAQGDLVHCLLDAHAAAVRSATPVLSDAQQTKLIAWIVKYRYGGTQDFFDPDIVAYAPGLSARSIQRYREAIAAIDLGPYGRYPLTRLAVLDRDPRAIVAAHGGEPTNSMLAARIVDDLDEAGLRDDAVGYARLGIGMDARGWNHKLVTFVVDDALARGDDAEAVTLRREWFARFPHATAFTALRETARGVGRWQQEQDAAESRLAEKDPAGFAAYLLRDEQLARAWQYASERVPVESNATLWLDLCAARARTHPTDTLPVYRTIVTDTLTVTDKRNYRAAASILQTMKKTATDVGADADFEAFLAETVERNRRRPTCLDVFARAKLIPRR